MQGRNQRSKKILLPVLLLAVVVGIVVLIWQILSDEEKPKWDDDLSQENINQITYNGKAYRYNDKLTNILFMGIDNSSGIREDNMPSDAGQADCIMLLTLDEDKEEARILQIPRDTMTEIDVYNELGNQTTIIQAQLATQYAYSIGGESSCWAVKKTVSELLFDLPIDGYLAMDYSSISLVNDAIGGVEITIPQDYTMIDPAFVEGETLTLTGKQAHDYVRYRDINEDFSNNDRMQRQVQYIAAMIETIRENMAEEEDYYKELYSLVEKYMVTDMEQGQMKDFMEYEFNTSDVQYVPGEGKKGEIYEEFYVDSEKLQKILIETFYILEE